MKKENIENFDYEARINAEMQKLVAKEGWNQEDADALIPAFFFCTTNSNESSRTFPEFCKLVLNTARERKGNVY